MFKTELLFFFRILRKLERTAFISKRHFCNIINVFTDTFVQFNTSLLNKSINFLYVFLILIVIYVFLMCTVSHMTLE